MTSTLFLDIAYRLRDNVDRGLPDQTDAVLSVPAKEYRDAQEFNGDEDPVFQMRPGKPWTEHFYKVQRKIFGAVGRDGRRGMSHALRHASISDMFQAQVPLNVIMAHHGHRQVSTTLRYAHAQEESLKAAAAELAKRRRGSRVN